QILLWRLQPGPRRIRSLAGFPCRGRLCFRHDCACKTLWRSARFDLSCVLLRQQGLLELRGWSVSQRPVQPLLVLDLVNEPFQAHSSLGQIAVFLPEHLLVFQGLHPRFTPTVLPWARLVTHTDPAAVGFQHIGVIMGSVLAAAIGMMHQTESWLSLLE